jgi:hypothetical protein
VPFAIPLVFFVNSKQNTIIEKALNEILSRRAGTQNDKKTKSQYRAEALTAISEHYLKTGGFADAQKH